jgi:NADH-quinone oxidoreductase subunit M
VAEDLRPRELVLMLAFAALVLAFGVFPELLLDVMSTSAQAWVARLG